MKAFLTIAIIALFALKTKAQTIEVAPRTLDTNHVWHLPNTPNNLFKPVPVTPLVKPGVLLAFSTMPVKHLSTAGIERMPVAHLSSNDKMVKKIVVDQPANQ